MTMSRIESMAIRSGPAAPPLELDFGPDRAGPVAGLLAAEIFLGDDRPSTLQARWIDRVIPGRELPRPGDAVRASVFGDAVFIGVVERTTRHRSVDVPPSFGVQATERYQLVRQGEPGRRFSGTTLDAIAREIALMLGLAARIDCAPIPVDDFETGAGDPLLALRRLTTRHGLGLRIVDGTLSIGRRAPSPPRSHVLDANAMVRSLQVESTRGRATTARVEHLGFGPTRPLDAVRFQGIEAAPTGELRVRRVRWTLDPEGWLTDLELESSGEAS